MGHRRSIDTLLGGHDGEDNRWSVSSSYNEARRVPGCFYDGGDGLELCTESLGSESGDGRLDPEEEEALLEGTAWAAAGQHDDDDDDGDPDSIGVADGGLDAAWRRREQKKAEFPPPLRWMAGDDGRRTRIIRAERRDGRLVLTELRIERPEIFRATREGGRLWLQAVGSERYEEKEEEEEEEEEEETEELAATTEENEEWREWQRGGMGEGYRRCQEPVNCKHEVPAWWRHRFVTMA